MTLSSIPFSVVNPVLNLPSLPPLLMGLHPSIILYLITYILSLAYPLCLCHSFSFLLKPRLLLSWCFCFLRSRLTGSFLFYFASCLHSFVSVNIAFALSHCCNDDFFLFSVFMYYVPSLNISLFCPIVFFVSIVLQATTNSFELLLHFHMSNYFVLEFDFHLIPLVIMKLYPFLTVFPLVFSLVLSFSALSVKWHSAHSCYDSLLLNWFLALKIFIYNQNV